MSDPTGIDFWSRLVEGSPTIVLILLAVIALGSRLSQLVILELLKRLDGEAGHRMQLQGQVLAAINSNTAALVDLREAIEREARQ